MVKHSTRPLKKDLEYFALADGSFEFSWTYEEIEKFEECWRNGISVWDIADYLKRDPDEVAVLLIDRARKGKIKHRKNGALGVVGNGK